MKVLTNEPNPEVIEVLERALERAKTGEILSVAVVYIDASPHLGAFDWWTRSNDRLTLTGALSLCADRIKAGCKISHRTP